MFDINEKMKRSIAVTYAKNDGTAGNVEGAPVWTTDLQLADLRVAADGMSADLVHNGAVGMVTVSIAADGDLGVGVFPIVLSDMFDMRPPMGAVGGSFVVGPEEPVA